MTPVVQLGEDEDRHDEILIGLAQQAGATVVIRVGRVERREQRSRVEHEGHLRRRMGDRLACQLRGREPVGHRRRSPSSPVAGEQSDERRGG